MQANRYQTAKGLSLAVVAAILVNLGWLTGLRRPIHDTYIGFFSLYRQLLVHELSNGSWPWWSPYERYGHTLSSFHFINNFLNPFGILLILVTHQYNYLLYAIEMTFMTFVGIVGSYLTFQKYGIRPMIAAALSIAYVSSGPVIKAHAAITSYHAFLVFPWIIYGLLLVQNNTIFSWTQSVIILSLSGSFILLTGYPPLYLSLPYFLFPILFPIFFLRSKLFLVHLLHCFSSIVLSSMIIFLLLSPWISETLFSSPFGESLRNIINPNEGALPLVSILGQFLVNPTYLVGISQPTINPTYFGFILSLVFFLFVRSLLPNISHNLQAIIFFCCVFLLCFLLNLTYTLNLNQRYDNYIAGVTVIWIIVSAPKIDLPRFAHARVVSIAATLSFIFSTDNWISNILRPLLFPFSISRWSSNYYTLFVFLILILVGNVFEQILRNVDFYRSYLKVIYRWFFTIFILFLTIVVIFPQNRALDQIINESDKQDRLSATSMIQILIVIVFLLLSVFYFNLVCNRNSRFVLIKYCLASAVYFIAYFGGSFFLMTETIVHEYLYFRFIQQILDFTLPAVLLGSGILLLRRFGDHTESVIAAMLITDALLAVPRFLSDTDMMIGGQPGPTVSISSDNFQGVRRRNDIDGMSAAIRNVPSSERPRPWDLSPQVRRLDDSLTNHDYFDYLVAFPATWEATASPEITASLLTPRVAPLSGSNGFIEQIEEPCPVGIGNSYAYIKSFSSSDLQIEVSTECERLLVVNDTWQQGWRAKINGDMIETYNVNQAVRGYIVPKGNSTLEVWYRPAYWECTRWFSLISIILLCNLSILLGLMFYKK